MKAKVTNIEDPGTSNLINVHHERTGENGIERGVVKHSRFSAHIPEVGDEIELDPANTELDDAAVGE